MNQLLAQKLINRLVGETLDGSRVWDPVYPPNDELEQTNKNMFFLLIQDEWRRIDFDRSFQLHFQEGFFFLLYETCDSGRDSTKFCGYRLYAQPTTESPITLLVSDTTDLYRLKNAIEEKEILPPAVNDFISEYLTV